MKPLDSISWPLIVVLCLTLGLSPYVPVPHVWQKLTMLLNGDLTQGVDIFDLIFHGTPWMLAIAKIIRG